MVVYFLVRLLTELAHPTKDVKGLLIPLFHDPLLTVSDQRVLLLLVKGELAVNFGHLRRSRWSVHLLLRLDISHLL